jgi:hypothetical protein
VAPRLLTRRYGFDSCAQNPYAGSGERDGRYRSETSRTIPSTISFYLLSRRALDAEEETGRVNGAGSIMLVPFD